ncbi:hypothetical protein ACFQ0Q_38235 [Streptomyces aureus]
MVVLEDRGPQLARLAQIAAAPAQIRGGSEGGVVRIVRIAYAVPVAILPR